MSLESDLEKLVLAFFEVNVVKFGVFKLKSGVNSPIYIDLRVIISYPKIMELLSNVLVNFIRNSNTDNFQHICGVPYTGLPIATLISSKTGTPMLIKRKEVKDHGTRKIIEGEYKNGDTCIIIEDVVSSGSSVLETIQVLEREGLVVKAVFVILDREQGGIKNLEDRGIKVHVLTPLTKVLQILLRHQKITQETVHEVKEYISSTVINSDGSLHTISGINKNRLKMPFSERAKYTKNKLTKRIFEIMEMKKTLLCLAADVTDSCHLLRLASQVGPHICIFKTHFDALQDFSKDSYLELVNLAKTYNFLIMEDRKFSDIGNTVRLQYNQIQPWADLVTAHSIAGEAIITALKSCEGNLERGCFLVAELSCNNNLITDKYSQETLKMAENHSDFVVGLVCQSPHLIGTPHLIQLTPGVKLEEGSDNLGQRYSDPEYVVLEKGADIAVVGRGIISSSDPAKAAITYKEVLWNAYEKRIT